MSNKKKVITKIECCGAKFSLGSRVAEVVRGRAPAEKSGLGRKLQARTYTSLSQIKICRDLRTFWRSLGKKSAFLWKKKMTLLPL